MADMPKPIGGIVPPGKYPFDAYSPEDAWRAHETVMEIVAVLKAFPAAKEHDAERVNRIMAICIGFLDHFEQ